VLLEAVGIGHPATELTPTSNGGFFYKYFYAKYIFTIKILSDNQSSKNGILLIMKHQDPFERPWDFDECVGAIAFGVPVALCSYSLGAITVEIIHRLVTLIQDA
jgi:hypothetical protein